MTKLILTIVFLSATKCNIIAQSNCPQDIIYTTNFLNNGKDSLLLKFALHFSITNDSIVISYAKVNRQFAAFRILNKACFWNEDF